MANDAATAPKLIEFRKSHPIDFSLVDKDDQAVMYISEDKGEGELNLTIANTSSQSITLKDSPIKQTTLPNHHFALRFRAGTLSQETLTLLTTNFAKFVQPQNWQIAQLTQKPVGNTPVTLYLRYTGATKELSQPSPYSLKLTGFTAAAGSGARGTQVELIPNPAQVVFTADNNSVTGSRTQYLHVTNHTGRKVIPLHVGLVGGDQVMTGAEESLKLRITNILRVKKDSNESAKIKFNGTGNKPSELVLSYDRGDSEWELGKSIVKVTAVNSKQGVTIAAVPDKNLPEWVITFNKDVSLDYGESIDIDIEKVLVSSKAGHANLYLHYNNIPGYWDGQFVCTVEKGSIVQKDGHVGIGTKDLKDATLNVAGGLNTDKAAITGELTANTITVTSTDAAKPALTVNGSTLMNFGAEGRVLFRGNNKANLVEKAVAPGLTICAENGQNIPQLHFNVETVFVPSTLVVGELEVTDGFAGIEPVKFEEVTFYFIGKVVPVNGKLDGRISNASDAGTEMVLKFPKPVLKATAFLSQHHLEFITSAESYVLVERPLAAVGVGAVATIDPTDKTKVKVKAWAVLSDNRKSVTDHFQGSAQVVVLASFNEAI